MGYIVTNINSLNSLLKEKKSSITDVIFDFSELTFEENQKYGKKFNKHYFACGCNTGTYFMVGAIILVISLYLFDLFFLEMGLLKWIIYSIIFVVVFALIGKLTGLLIAKIKLNILIHTIKNQCNKREPHLLESKL